MGRKPTPQPLTLADTNITPNHVVDGEPTFAEPTAQDASPVTARSPISLRSSPFSGKFALKRSQPGRSAPKSADDVSHRSQSPRADSAAPAYHHPISSPLEAPPVSSTHKVGHREAKKPAKSGFFHFNKSSKGSNQFFIPANQQQHHQDSREHLTSSGSDGVTVPRRGASPYAHDSLHRPTASIPSRSELSLSSVGDHEVSAAPSPGKKNKSNPFDRLSRTKTTHETQGLGSPGTGSAPPYAPSCRTNSQDPAPPRPAPLVQDRSFRDIMSSSVRNQSEDRNPGRDGGTRKERSRDRDQRAVSSARDNGGSHFLSGLRSSSTKAADMISKGLFGKSPRSGGTSDRESALDDEHYVVKVINLPLVEQTRLTRISKRLEDSKDKTEFWMPAFPWRAIDYLNYKGCDMEGLYRVPGSGPQVKKWQRKFDEEHDVNLFEQDGLYDINIIGSMLKAWLRELPDELFPKEAQDRVARECAGSTEVPQMLVDELSELSPFNYYLLFAITCHLSLLLAHSDKNKMDFRNLCICFQPCMKIDAFCFKFLVCDWRDCWKGCKNENKYIEEEYALFDQAPPRGLSEPRQPGKHEERHGSSPESAQRASASGGPRKGRSKMHRQDASESNASIGSIESSMSTNMTAQSDRNIIDGSRDLRPLSPIKPLSPLGF